MVKKRFGRTSVIDINPDDGLDEGMDNLRSIEEIAYDMPAALIAHGALSTLETMSFNDRGDSQLKTRLSWLQSFMQKVFSSEDSENLV